MKDYVLLNSKMDGLDIKIKITEWVDTKYLEVIEYEYIKHEQNSIFLP